jgi:hypothetical protein
MNEISISRRELDLVVNAVTEKHQALAKNGASGTDDHRALRELEDKLGSIIGEKFKLREASA